MTTSALIPPTPVINAPEGAYTRYTELQRALVYAVVTKRVGRSATAFIIVGALGIFYGIFIPFVAKEIFASDTLQKPHPFLTPAFVAVGGALVVTGLLVIGCSVAMMHAQPATGLVAMEIAAMLGQIQSPLMNTVVCFWFLEESFLLKDSALHWFLFLLFGATLMLWVFVAFYNIPQGIKRIRRSRRYRSALATHPTEEMKAESEVLLDRLLNGAPRTSQDMIEFQGRGFLWLHMRYRGLLRDDTLIIGSMWAGTARKLVFDLFFLSPGGLVIEPRRGQAPSRRQRATFYLEDLRVKGTIEAGYLQRYETWKERHVPMVEAPG